jgi:hypothetical protein
LRCAQVVVSTGVAVAIVNSFGQTIFTKTIRNRSRQHCYI